MALLLVPMTIRRATELVSKWHEHHKPPQGARFAVGVGLRTEKRKYKVVGAAMIGNPVARMNNDGWTCEITRLVVRRKPQVKNACSILYAASARAAFNLGFRRIITYVLKSESGVSLKAAGWVKSDVKSGGGSWSRPSRQRTDKHPLEAKVRWEKTL